MYKERVFLMSGSNMKEKVLIFKHDASLGGHPVLLKMYRDVRLRFVWRWFKEDVYKHIREYIKCQDIKIENVFPPRFCSPYLFPNRNGKTFP